MYRIHASTLGAASAWFLLVAGMTHAKAQPADDPIVDGGTTFDLSLKPQIAGDGILLTQLSAANGPPSGNALPQGPVGMAPEQVMSDAQNNALPEGARVLTPRGQFILEPSLEYDRTSSDRLVFSGVEIVPGLQLGLVNANDVAGDTFTGNLDVRYGIFDRAEIEVRVPYTYNLYRLTVLNQQVATGVPGATQTTYLKGHNIGDVEFSLRYQLNQGMADQPIYVAGLRVKTATGTGPYDVPFDANGIAQGLATGSGFWALEPNVTVLYPIDPVVLFANLGYLHNFARDIDKTIGTTLVGRVTPGDGIDVSFGFGFAINQQFALALGFADSYILASKSVLGGTSQRSPSLEAGALTVGWSVVLNPRVTIASNIAIGATPDAPNLRLLFRVPIRF